MKKAKTYHENYGFCMMKRFFLIQLNRDNYQLNHKFVCLFSKPQIQFIFFINSSTERTDAANQSRVTESRVWHGQFFGIWQPSKGLVVVMQQQTNTHRRFLYKSMRPFIVCEITYEHEINVFPTHGHMPVQCFVHIKMYKAQDFFH